MSSVIEFGIDLGTTNSCIARWEAGTTRVFQNNDQMNVTPSAIHMLKSGRMIVGRRACAALLADPENVAVEFKRWLGQKDRLTFPANHKDFSSEELSAEILKSLKEDVRRSTGEDLTTAVITVPAAFGALQCEATARAASLAGLVESPLLQEPIAAAVGYGIKPEAGNQKWLVFDLGGGTLDIAIISTKDGRLNVLEHRGHNLLGGKDVDRLIVEEIILPKLSYGYSLSSVRSGARSRLRSRLLAKAEEAKIDLSRESQITVSLFDVGEDDAGATIDHEMLLTRAELQKVMAPLLEKCCSLTQEAIRGARLTPSDLDRILLVGGPTQSPILRERLQAQFGAILDFSVDPMTVVGRGAAVYAATLEKAKTVFTAPAPQTVTLKLAFEPVSAELRPTVAGMVTSEDRNVEIKIDAEGALWTSGWILPAEGFFEISLHLKQADVTTFWLYARNQSGRVLETQPSEFRIRHGLVPAAPPLPHTLSFEFVGADGKPQLDPIFAKSSPLPVEASKLYRAAHIVDPKRPESSIAIKLWEGEHLAEPDANEWVCNLMLAHDGVRRAIPQNAEIEVHIKVSTSRLIEVSAFVPILNQHFSNNVYLPQREEKEYSELSQAAAQSISGLEDRLIDMEAASPSDAQLQAEIDQLRAEIERLQAANLAPSILKSNERTLDPDDARRLVEETKEIKGKIARLERKAAVSPASAEVGFSEYVEDAEQVVGEHGTTMDKTQLTAYKRELARQVERGDNKAVARVTAELKALRWRVLFRHDWFWTDILDNLSEPGVPYVDRAAANNWIAKGRDAVKQSDGKSLREAVRALWALEPKTEAEREVEGSLASGIRKY